MKLENIIEFIDWLFKFTANMTNDHIIGEQDILYMVKDKFSSLGLNDNKIDKEQIDESKLDELANSIEIINKLPIPYDDCTKECIECFKIGYRSAFNNKKKE